MKDETKAKLKALEYMVSCAKHAQRTKDPRDKLAAVELEIEFTDRISALRKADKEPELSLQTTEHQA